MEGEPIDIMALYIEGNYARWNDFLSKALREEDVNGLASVRRRLQAGMDRLAKQKMNTDKIVVFFLRLQKSIEDTLFKIHKAKHPNPLYTATDKSGHREHLADKRAKRADLERFLKKTSY